MALNSGAVPMPEKKITYKKGSNGTEYVYYTLRAYRNKDGKPTSDEIAIGKKDKATGMLIPNRRYYEVYPDHSLMNARSHKPVCIRSCGNTAALMASAKQSGLTDTLMSCFPEKWKKILACSFYILCEGNVMMYIEDWFDETKVGFTEQMDDLDCSNLFASITEEERRSFFAEWVRYRREREYIAYDITSISTYSRNIEIAEWGYNRDQDKLPQVNLGMYYGVTSHLPLYYNMFSGSIPDKSYLEFMMSSAKDIGIRDVCFVMDRGFVTEGNFQCMRGHEYSFVTAMPGQRLDALRLIDDNKGNIRKSANRISEYEVYGLRCAFEMYGLLLQAHIYYDPEKQAFDEKELYGRIEKLQAELEKLNKSKRVTKRYKDYFVVDEKAQDALSFELDTEKVDERLERAGFFILLSSNPELSSAETLKIYRGRDLIEKNFDQFKNRLDFKRMRTHWNKTTDGKMFVGFLSLILRSYMSRALKGDAQTKNLTFEKVLIELRKIKSVTFFDTSEALIPLTKLQKTILSVLNVPTDDLSLSSP